MACVAQERTPDWPAWENAGFRNHADHTATPEFREGMAELRELGRAHTCAALCAEAAWWRCHRRTNGTLSLNAAMDVNHVQFESDNSGGLGRAVRVPI